MNKSNVLYTDQIKSNIDEYGCHVYLISSEVFPRYVYTIGMTDLIGKEIILAGGSYYTAKEAYLIVNSAAQEVRKNRNTDNFCVEGLGSFKFTPAVPEWTDSLMLGALDYYGVPSIEAMQIIPNDEFLTIDIPDLSIPWSTESDPVWLWLFKSWPFSIPQSSTAMTNLAALKGEKITEAARWEEDQWELFAGSGPDTAECDFRVVPISTLLAFDQSLFPVAELAVGKALWRGVSELEWYAWGER